VGYFTKYGDGAADVLPIVYLTKGEVREAAKLYGLSSVLAERVPSAGLFEGQTDEGEMGITYKDLDNYLLGGKVEKSVEERIEHLHKISEHKRIPIPTPKEFKR
jgi:NAD+ synthase